WRPLIRPEPPAPSTMQTSYAFFPLFGASRSPALVTAVAAGILESFALFGNELPVVTLGFQRQLQNTEGRRVAHVTDAFRLSERAMILAARANHEFTNPVLSV